jgi:hypothetical protein
MHGERAASVLAAAQIRKIGYPRKIITFFLRY